MKLTHTADLYDRYGEHLQIASLGLRSFGGRSHIQGPVETVRCFEDNSKVAAVLGKKGHDRILVVDGGGSLHCALLGDNLAALALTNGWAGVVINGAIRDAALVSSMNIGIWALGTTPRKSFKKDRGEVGVEVGFLGMRIYPGNYAYCDQDGLVISEEGLLN